MQNRWNESTMPIRDALDEATWGTRALGAHEEAVLHGGGNSSLKDVFRDVTGEERSVIYVKGSGWDMGSIDRTGFAPLRLDRVRALLEVEHITDAELINELRLASFDAHAPDASIEAPLHALLPHRAVLHSHADAIVALTDQPESERLARTIFGEHMIIVPYVMPGFGLARTVRDMWVRESSARTTGLLLLRHGLFTFGDTMEQAYRKHAELVTAAENALGWRSPAETREATSARGARPEPDYRAIARLRRDISEAAAKPMLLAHHSEPIVEQFLSRPDLESVATRGPATPEHVIRTRRTPLIGRDVESFATSYTQYFERNRARHPGVTMLDPAPRYVLDTELGMFTAGTGVRETTQVRDIAVHTMHIIEAAERSTSYEPITEADAFDVEYWELEQAKLRQATPPAPLRGQVALVTGAASGIGKACAGELLALGATVVGLDISASVTDAFTSADWLGIATDVTDTRATQRALNTAVLAFGGIDLLVIAAGVFTPSAPLVDIDAKTWERTFAINVDSVHTMLARVHPYLVESPVTPHVVIIGSKNVTAPGPGAAAYSASKAALTQLARVAAMEWAADGIRVNTVHPDAVFDTALWSEALLAERASKYGVTVAEYKSRNLLSTTVTSATVAKMVGVMCTDVFSATTGAQVPVDGGNERVI